MIIMKKKQNKNQLLPAIPPEGYKGGIANWMIKMQEKGYWNGENPSYYGNVNLTKKQYNELLAECDK
jgi:hypothetical protein